MSNERLLELAREGDSAALRKLLEEMQPQILRYGMSMCGHVQDAEDILQDTMLSVAQNLPEFRGDSSLSTWVYRIAKSACAKKRRTSKFAPKQDQQLVDATDDLSHDTDPHTTAEAKETWSDVAGALAKLDAEAREVLVLRDVEGLSAKEAAEVVGLSVPALKSRLHRARKTLREALGGIQQHPGCPDVASAFSKNLEGELTSSACAEMEAHLAECPHCKTICDGLKADLRICQSAPSPRVSRELSERIRAAIAKIPTSAALGAPSSRKP